MAWQTTRVETKLLARPASGLAFTALQRGDGQQHLGELILDSLRTWGYWIGMPRQKEWQRVGPANGRHTLVRAPLKQQDVVLWGEI